MPIAQLHPIALGCMLVVAVGTLIYTYVSTRNQQQRPHGYSAGTSQPFRNYDDIPYGSSKSSEAGDSSGPTRRNTKESEFCTICLGPLKRLKKTLTCKHVFHENCIDVWLNNNPSCPICRKATNV